MNCLRAFGGSWSGGWRRWRSEPELWGLKLFDGEDGDEGGVCVAHGDVGLAEADFDGFTEGGAADDFDLGTGDETEFAQAGEAGFGAEKSLDDGRGVDGKVCEGGNGHGRR